MNRKSLTAKWKTEETEIKNPPNGSANPNEENYRRQIGPPTQKQAERTFSLLRDRCVRNIFLYDISIDRFVYLYMGIQVEEKKGSVGFEMFRGYLIWRNCLERSIHVYDLNSST